MGLAGRAAPWAALASGRTLFFDEVITRTAEGDSASRAARHQRAPVVEAGVAVAIRQRVGVGIAVDRHMVGYPDRFALPGAPARAAAGRVLPVSGPV